MKHTNGADIQIPSLRKRKIQQVENKLRNMGYSEKRIQIIKDYLYALCHSVIKVELGKLDHD